MGKYILLFLNLMMYIALVTSCTTGRKNVRNSYIFTGMKTCDSCGWAMVTGNKDDASCICFRNYDSFTAGHVQMYDSISDGVTYIRNYTGGICLYFTYLTGSNAHVRDAMHTRESLGENCYCSFQGANHKDVDIQNKNCKNRAC